jgi:class 3 adenylate cyclase
MAIAQDLIAVVDEVLSTRWSTRQSNVVPDSEDLALTNDAVTLDATVLYADLADSTHLVDIYTAEFAAEIYKCYLHCAAKVVTSEGGVITAYDGDRLMAVYLGDSKNTAATRSALKINYAVTKILNPLLAQRYQKPYSVKQVVGVDTSPLLVARTGIRGSNDLVWVGRAANYAAKLSAIDESFSTWITEAVYDRIKDNAKFSKGQSMWESRFWTAMNNVQIYRSNWWWEIS